MTMTGTHNVRNAKIVGMPKMITQELTQIKKTKSVSMAGDTKGVTLYIERSGEHVWIPKNILFQVKRGLESYAQRFYRKK